ncbi:MAG: single-stranded DNA-binding protein [Saprospiraceae bacterium]|nr:single-stranded DNA-binding protein [Saprospiraceae bacterium]
MLNKVILIGNLGKDPEIRTLENNVMRATVSIATNESYKDRNGNWQKATEWHDIVLWRAMAERSKSLRKGMLVYVEGKLTHRKWTDKEGRDRYASEIVADVLRILEKRDAPHTPPSGYQQEEKNQDDLHTNTSQEDLPF